MKITDLINKLELGQSQISKVKMRLNKKGFIIDDYISDNDALMILTQRENYICLDDVFRFIKSDIMTVSVKYKVSQKMKSYKKLGFIKATDTLFAYGKTNDYYFKKIDIQKVLIYIKIELSMLLYINDNEGYASLASLNEKIDIDTDELVDLICNESILFKEEDIILFHAEELLKWNAEKLKWKDLWILLKLALRGGNVEGYKEELIFGMQNYIQEGIIIIKKNNYFYLAEKEKEVIEQIDIIINFNNAKRHTIKINVAARRIGIPVSVIWHQIELGNLDAEEREGKWYLSQINIDSILSQKMNYKVIWAIVDKLIVEYNSRFNPALISNREALYSYLEKSDYFQVDYLKERDILFDKTGRNNIYVRNTDEDIIINNIRMFIAMYGFSESEKYLFIRNINNIKVRGTSELLEKFARQVEVDRSFNEIYLLIKTEIDNEIFKLNDEQIKDIIKKLKTKKSKEVFTKFIYFVRRNKRVRYNTFAYAKFKTPKTVKISYSFNQVVEMAKLIFNENQIIKNKLIDKAISKSKYLEMWLYVSLHYVCGWRSVDMISKCRYLFLSKGIVDKPYDITDADVIFDNIRNNTIPDKTYEDIAEYVFVRLLINREEPSKTEEHSPGPLEIELLPQLKKHFGRLILLAEAHNLKNARGYMSKGRVSEYKSRINWAYFFGNETKEILKKRNFQSTLMNRSYEQAQEKIALSKGWNGLTAYMIASFARTHIGYLQKLSESTAMYLEDGNFAGEDAQTIIYEMFERGVMGFIPYKLLLSCYPTLFSQLSYKDKTKLIQMTGLSIDEIVTALKGFITIKKLEEASMSGETNKSFDILLALHRISNGYGESKNNGCYCLKRAMGFACPYPKKTICIDCENNIITKYGLPAIIKAVQYYRGKYYETNNQKYRVILNTVIQPAIKDVLKAFQMQLNQTEQQSFLNEIKELMA